MVDVIICIVLVSNMLVVCSAVQSMCAVVSGVVERSYQGGVHKGDEGHDGNHLQEEEEPACPST